MIGGLDFEKNSGGDCVWAGCVDCHVSRKKGEKGRYSHKIWRGGHLMKKLFLLIVSVLSIAGIAITAVCMPEDRFGSY